MSVTELFVVVVYKRLRAFPLIGEPHVLTCSEDRTEAQEVICVSVGKDCNSSDGEN